MITCLFMFSCIRPVRTRVDMLTPKIKANRNLPKHSCSQGLSSSRTRKREKGETLVGAGHVCPREKLDPGKGPFCQDLLSTPNQGFGARSPRETYPTVHV